MRDIARDLPDLPILMLSASRAGEDVTDAMHEGASGYVLKDTSFGRLAEAVRAAGAGERPMSRRAVGGLIDQARLHDRRAALADGRGASLTDREWELLASAADADARACLPLAAMNASAWRSTRATSAANSFTPLPFVTLFVGARAVRGFMSSNPLRGFDAASARPAEVPPP